MKKIKIKRNTLGDTRTATKVPTFYEFVDSNGSHVTDVSNMMDYIAEKIRLTGDNHDYTKTNDPERSLFYRELCATIEGKMDSFVDGEWYPMHCKTERHHLNEYCPDDVTLIDVIEMICDCVCAGFARSGNVRPVEISTDILKQAVDNTVKMLVDIVEVERCPNDTERDIINYIEEVSRMSKDTIYRQDAVDALERKKDKNAKGDIGGFYNKIIQNDIDTLMQMPPAQPEIIRCKDCMHNGSFDTDCPIDWAGKEYCNFAERRTDE